MKTKYSYVKSEIKSKIMQGYFQPHEKVGSENELLQEYGVSRHTIRKAVDELVNEGWIYKKQGAGTFCADRTAEEPVRSNRKNIAVITTYFSDYIFPSIIRGAEKVFRDNGYQVTVFSTNNDHEEEKKCLEAVLSQQFDGLMIEPTKSALPNPNINYYLNIERMGIPYVMINAYYEELEPVHFVMDDVEGGRLQTKHLLELGHEKIIGLFKNDDIQGTKRMQGFIKAHREHGTAMSPQNIVTYTTETRDTVPVEELRRKLKDASNRPTALVCYNDQLALRLMDVVREMKLSVPRDISIVGFDNSYLSTASEIKLTTVAHPQEKLGADAAQTVLDMVENTGTVDKKKQVESVVFESALVKRHSASERRAAEVKR
ncbi:GntR family transcriptional regulator [Paenalkalicoccus suaedae]|uniref:GntR family transcriptional regulator n=1 Tax=Paenalkalicoccus suaedae TaxID=2592382 RepID=A0A859FCS9_9BACI|nr:GntR family transcriptional regulator [Paenalkalicoccus suaedae]QKS70026.1 GntR family transcriptional regulator [Paenalkalicoccus suaedae]